MNKFAVLINSCDSYFDVWPIFFKILKDTWPELKEYKIYLNTEQKNYTDDFFDIHCLHPKDKKNIKWGHRLRDALDSIEEEYILFLLEDFFFEKPIVHEKILDIFNWVISNKSIAGVSLTPTYDIINNKNYNDYGLIKRKKHINYSLNASPTIYRKDFLRLFTRKNDSPWVWEYFGSIRTWNSYFDFYSYSNLLCPLFDYDIEHGGAIHRGKWVGCSVRNILEKHSMKVDLEKRGVIEDWILSNPEKPKHNIVTISKNKLKFVLNYFLSFYYRKVSKKMVK